MRKATCATTGEASGRSSGADCAGWSGGAEAFARPQSRAVHGGALSSAPHAPSSRFLLASRRLLPAPPGDRAVAAAAARDRRAGGWRPSDADLV
ncbi:hypothetical protein CVH10_17215, partial [Halomonas sp. ND22Bw]